LLASQKHGNRLLHPRSLHDVRLPADVEAVHIVVSTRTVASTALSFKVLKPRPDSFHDRIGRALREVSRLIV
jgi:hypothetical protein